MTVTLFPRPADIPKAYVYPSSDGRGRWMVLRLGDDLTLHLPDYNATSAAYARQIARDLIAAADEIDATLQVGAESTADREAAASRTAGPDGPPLLSAPAPAVDDEVDF